ncbi:MAG: hypothetical protein V4659_13650 [Pseudomonadota bacterium]
MRERQKAMLAIVALLLVASAFHRPIATVAVDPNLADPAPTAAQAAVDLGVLGTVVLGWTAKKLR